MAFHCMAISQVFIIHSPVDGHLRSSQCTVNLREGWKGPKYGTIKDHKVAFGDDIYAKLS